MIAAAKLKQYRLIYHHLFGTRKSKPRIDNSYWSFKMADLRNTTPVKATSVPTSSVDRSLVQEYVNESAAATNPGKLYRKFKARHVQMIALARNIFSGVFISIDLYVRLDHGSNCV
jgi:amino acid permease